MTYRMLIRLEAQEPTDWIATDEHEVAVDLSPAQAELLRDTLIHVADKMVLAMYLGGGAHLGGGAA